VATYGRELPGELQKIKEWFRDYKVRLCAVQRCGLLLHVSRATLMWLTGHAILQSTCPS